MTGHFGMRVWCQVCSAPQIPQHPRSARSGHTLDICQTNSDLTERQDNAAPWLCAQYHTQSFLPHGGVWGESHYGTHFGITMNSRQPPIHVQTWSSPPTQVSVQTSQAVWPKDEAHNIPFQSHPIAVSTLWPCSVTCKRRVGLIAFQLRNEHRFQTRLAMWIHTEGFSNFSHFYADLRAVNSARPRTMCGKQESQNDGWARQSPQVAQCKARGNSRRGGGMQQAVAPSHSLGEAPA